MVGSVGSVRSSIASTDERLSETVGSLARCPARCQLKNITLAPRLGRTRQPGARRTAPAAQEAGFEKTITDAAAASGASRDAKQALSRPYVADLLRTNVLKSFAMAGAPAGAVKEELLDSDNELVRDRASALVLGLAGRPMSAQHTARDVSGMARVTLGRPLVGSGLRLHGAPRRSIGPAHGLVYGGCAAGLGWLGGSVLSTGPF
jgi:hypothetical protein